VRIARGRIGGRPPYIIIGILAALLDGFGGLARIRTGSSNVQFLRILRYGFQFRKSDLEQSIVRDSIGRASQTIEGGFGRQDPTAALIAGVDEAWEVCLLKFTMDLIQRSSGENLDEWKRRGLI
jgi:hypothetical protein